ncbi:MAG: undecaprenyl-phosphate glucose phosphotransferase [Lachnospiraceae bacterium]|nr:undecaprenyl-phosphate glucose phosphotransferase [Lachnospiraceae bacterium]
MIKENQKYLNRFQVVLDAVVIYVAFCLSYYIRFTCPLFYNIFSRIGYYRLFIQYQWMFLVIIPVFLLFNARFNLYKPRRYRHAGEEYRSIIKADSCSIILLLMLVYFFQILHVPRSLMLMFYLMTMILTILERFLIRWILQRTRKGGRNLKHVLIIGYSHAAEMYIRRIKRNPQWGYYIHGILDDNLDEGFEYKDIPVVGKISNLETVLSDNDFDEVAITLALKEYHKLEGIVATCEKSGVHTKFIPDYYKFIPTHPVTEDLAGLPVINIRNVPLTNTFNKFVKRAMDIFGSIFAIILFSPIMLVTAILVKKSSPGPIIFCQERIGLHNKPFKMYKFRSMGVQKPSEEKKQWTVKDDPRVTPIGKIIRKTSIDELPQLFNVLKGDMSLIGPRPERPLFVEQFKETIPRYMIKHQVRPGMTGWAQVNGFRGDTSIEGRIQHDIYYIENWTLGFDIRILFLTVFKGFVNKNAY